MIPELAINCGLSAVASIKPVDDATTPFEPAIERDTGENVASSTLSRGSIGGLADQLNRKESSLDDATGGDTIAEADDTSLDQRGPGRSTDRDIPRSAAIRLRVIASVSIPAPEEPPASTSWMVRVRLCGDSTSG